MAANKIPKEFEIIRQAALRAIQPIQPVEEQIIADGNFPFNTQRTNAGRALPPYYLVYFLLVDLLEFPNLGQHEKVAWSVPIDFEGEVFLIEYRKLGLGIFANDASSQEHQAQQIVTLIKKGVKVAEPFFEWLAKQAVQKSEVNVLNKSESLFKRFEYFLDLYKTALNEAKERANECHIEKIQVEGATTTFYMPAMAIKRNATWLALAAIDAFFSWTEHIFIHLAILEGKITSGLEVAELAEADWQMKFKLALDIDEPEIKILFDKLVLIRRQLRNFMAHGAFGKRGEAFTFHSGTGAVPVLLPHQSGKYRFVLPDTSGFEESSALEVIEKFIRHLWTGRREPAQLYIQKSSLPLILTMAKDGAYSRAMQSVENMQRFIEYLIWNFDQAANMDW